MGCNTPPSPKGGWEQPLKYLVLDEFHTYDGAQGTDVAARRLGHRVSTSTPSSPLDGVVCIGTSATLGSSPTATTDMRQFAERVFGQPFDETSVIGEQRQTVEQVCADIDLSLPTPKPETVIALDPSDADALALAFTGTGFDDPQEVGDRLLRHPLTSTLLQISSASPRAWDDVVLNVGARTERWCQTAIDTLESSVLHSNDSLACYRSHAAHLNRRNPALVRDRGAALDQRSHPNHKVNQREGPVSLGRLSKKRSQCVARTARRLLHPLR